MFLQMTCHDLARSRYCFLKTIFLPPYAIYSYHNDRCTVDDDTDATSVYPLALTHR